MLYKSRFTHLLSYLLAEMMMKPCFIAVEAKTLSLAIGLGVGIGLAVIILIVVIIAVSLSAKRRQRRRFTCFLLIVT